VIGALCRDVLTKGFNHPTLGKITPLRGYGMDIVSVEKINNAVSALFYIENSSPEELEEKTDILIKIIKRSTPQIS